MDSRPIRGLADLDALPAATVRAAYLAEDQIGSEEAHGAVLRVIATIERDVRDGVEPEDPEALPALLEGALAVLAAERLELWAEIPEPGAAPIVNTFVGSGITQVLDATLVRIRFVIRRRPGIQEVRQ